MELERYHELRTLLQQWKARLAENIRRQIEDTSQWLARLRTIYESEGADEEFTLWLDRWCRQASIQFVLRILFLRVLEDRRLLGAERIRNTDGQKMWSRLTRNLGAAGYVRWCCWDAAHLLPDLFGPTEYDLILPDNELVQRFLDDIWRRPDPNRPGWLRFDFRSDPERGDQGFQTRFIGDLYQELDAEIRERYALLQTPHFISQFILEHTLLKRFEEKDFREVTLMDPTIGSGHFAVDGFWMFVHQYEKSAGRGRRQLTVAERATIARTIIEHHLFGCDINPYATALARFRLLLAAYEYAQPGSVRDLQNICFNIITIDSLIPYEKLLVSGLRADSETAKTLGQPNAIREALPILKRRFDVVVGNPPYIAPRDAIKRDFYREQYESASGKYGLSAPFTERFLRLSLPDGYVGLINSNAFARRSYGKKLVQSVLPSYEIQTIIDLSGAYIPGHGTPTLILLARNQKPADGKVLVISNLKGEAGTPADPVRGKVWSSIRRGMTSGPGYIDEYVDVALQNRSLLAEHPWQFGGPATRLYRSLQTTSKELAEVTEWIGVGIMTNADDIFRLSPDFARRLQLPPNVLKLLLTGEPTRDWAFVENSLYVVFPFDSDLNNIDISKHPTLESYLVPNKSALENRVVFGGQTYREAGKCWFDYHQITPRLFEGRQSIALPKIATHNHATIQPSDRPINSCTYVVKIDDQVPHTAFLYIGLVNCALACFVLKQIGFNKGAGRDPVRDRYHYQAAAINRILIPGGLSPASSTARLLIEMSQEMVDWAEQLPRLSMLKLFESPHEAYHEWGRRLDGYVPRHDTLLGPFYKSNQLYEARDWAIAFREDVRHRMVFLQEEMDWLAYEMYGLIEDAPKALDYLTPEQYKKARLQLGQRPFELAGKAYRGDWPRDYEPDPLPDALKELTDARITIMEANGDIRLLENPLYKRRWIPPDYGKEFQSAAEWWLAEKLEFALEQYGRPISLRRWAGLLARDERVNAALEVLTGSPMFDLEQELLKVIRANAVPNRPEHFLKVSGLRKLRAQDAQLKSLDFSDSTAWRIRGKLNIPRERFIAYTEFDATQRGEDVPENGGPWFGWAGWDAAQRAEALVYLLEQAGRAGWELHFRQCGLRANLRELLQKGDLDHLSEADRLEFEGIAGMCGIGLESRCYCQAYRDGISRGEPGVLGVSAEVLQVKVLGTSGKSGRIRKKKEQDKPNQMRMDL